MTARLQGSAGLQTDRVINGRSQACKQQCCAHTHRHTLQHSSSCLAVSSPTSPHSSRHNSSQNFPFVKVKLKAKQLHGPERCLWTDESQCHTSIRAAHIHPSPSLNIPSSWYPDVGNVRHTRGRRERKEGKDSWGRAVS